MEESWRASTPTSSDGTRRSTRASSLTRCSNAHHEEYGINGGIAQDGRHPGIVFYIEVEKIDPFLAKVEEQGGKTVLPRTEAPMVTLAQFADPDGHVVGLVEKGSGQQRS